MRFTVGEEQMLFAESVRAALAGWQAPLEPEFGTWWDDRDDALAGRLQALGWAGLWADRELLGATVAGALELGRAVAPLGLVDEATLGAPLCVAGRARHAAGARTVAAARPGGGLALVAGGDGVHEPTLDGTGTLRGLEGAGEDVEDAGARWAAWGAATLAYLAGVAGGALDATVEHARNREQFGASIGALPAVRAKLADAALACDGLVLVAWGAAVPEGAPGRVWDELAWAGAAAREVTAGALQVHGAIGFALEGGVHRYFRRAKVVQVWADAVRAAVAAAGAA